jgi:hypothetical protein
MPPLWWLDENGGFGYTGPRVVSRAGQPKARTGYGAANRLGLQKKSAYINKWILTTYHEGAYLNK